MGTPAIDVSGASAYVNGKRRWIPAFAGLTNKRPFHHSREGGNPVTLLR